MMRKEQGYPQENIQEYTFAIIQFKELAEDVLALISTL
jgi:hypothetical protein